MMKLSTMKKVVDTVNNKWRSPLAEEILERWGYDEGSVYYFRASANFIFIFKRDGETYFLRFSDASEKDISSLESEIAILEYLRGQPIRVALPVKSISGQYIESVETEIGTFYAVVLEALPGKQYETEELRKEQFSKWGSTLGELHTILKNMPEEYRLSRKSYHDQLSFIKKHLPTNEFAASNELEQVLDWLNDLEVTNENFGLIHFDFELDNQLWDDDTIGMLDFDDCINHWYVADIAFALRDLLKTDMKHPLVQDFLTGYTEKTDLDLNLIKQLPMFIRLHNLLTFSALLRTLDIPDSPDHPEWLGNLRGKLLNYIDEYRTSFKKNANESNSLS